MNNNPKHNPIEEELNAIRIKIYEQTKSMTVEEQADFFNRRTREAFAKYGITSKIVTAPLPFADNSPPPSSV